MACPEHPPKKIFLKKNHAPVKGYWETPKIKKIAIAPLHKKTCSSIGVLGNAKIEFNSLTKNFFQLLRL